MITDGHAFMIDSASVFFNHVRIAGWFHAPSDRLIGVAVTGAATRANIVSVGLPHPGVAAAYGPGKGFKVELLLDDGQDPSALQISFETASGKQVQASIADLRAEREAGYAGRALFHKFIDMVNHGDGLKILDIGGRARSGLDRSKLFHRAQCTVLDILPGDNVDVVGDAHALSELFPPASFDAMFSSSVFEHILMPWIVAAEMSKVLKPGGIAMVATHQTIGMHDQPWDFWRFSDTAWDALFNRLTGFEIIDRALENPQYIIPHFANPARGRGLENAVGFIGSSVLARKIGEPAVNWGRFHPADVIDTAYPDTPETDPAARRPNGP